jgi:SsrA-binding protein
MKFKVILRPDAEDGGFNVSCPALPGCHSQGETMDEAMANIKEAYVRVANNEVEIIGMHISPYEKGITFNKYPIRTRKLLLHKKEIIKLSSSVAQKGLTLVPLTLYLKQGLVKLEVGVARGKKLYDKRQDIKARDAQRQQDIASKMSR